MSPVDKRQRMDHFFATHREGGLPVTTQRRGVFEAILARTDHPTAEQLYQAVRVQLPQISRMTVHRILNTFVSLGVVAKTCHPGSVARFDPKLRQHHHLVCLSCGRIIDVEDPRLNRIPWPKISRKEFQIEDYHVNFHGRCSDCCERLPARQCRSNGQRTLAGTDESSSSVRREKDRRKSHEDFPKKSPHSAV
jgi:Fur family transcriptional regulator, peroxide stress response regulator